jgi:hypothetical protein
MEFPKGLVTRLVSRVQTSWKPQDLLHTRGNSPSTIYYTLIDSYSTDPIQFNSSQIGATLPFDTCIPLFDVVSSHWLA